MIEEPKLRTTATELRKQSDDAFEYGADIAAEYLNKAASTIDTLLAENARLRDLLDKEIKNTSVLYRPFRECQLLLCPDFGECADSLKDGERCACGFEDGPYANAVPKNRAFTIPPELRELSERATMPELHVGAQNDILYLIDKPPRPSTDEIADIPDVNVYATFNHAVTADEAKRIAASFNFVRSLIASGEARPSALDAPYQDYPAVEKGNEK